MVFHFPPMLDKQILLLSNASKTERMNISNSFRRWIMPHGELFYPYSDRFSYRRGVEDIFLSNNKHIIKAYWEKRAFLPLFLLFDHRVAGDMVLLVNKYKHEFFFQGKTEIMQLENVSP